MGTGDRVVQQAGLPCVTNPVSVGVRAHGLASAGDVVQVHAGGTGAGAVRSCAHRATWLRPSFALWARAGDHSRTEPGGRHPGPRPRHRPSRCCAPAATSICPTPGPPGGCGADVGRLRVAPHAPGLPQVWHTRRITPTVRGPGSALVVNGQCVRSTSAVSAPYLQRATDHVSTRILPPPSPCPAPPPCPSPRPSC